MGSAQAQKGGISQACVGGMEVAPFPVSSRGWGRRGGVHGGDSGEIERAAGRGRRLAMKEDPTMMPQASWTRDARRVSARLPYVRRLLDRLAGEGASESAETHLTALESRLRSLVAEHLG